MKSDGVVGLETCHASSMKLDMATQVTCSHDQSIQVHRVTVGSLSVLQSSACSPEGNKDAPPEHQGGGPAAVQLTTVRRLQYATAVQVRLFLRCACVNDGWSF
jgi:hypothetical protein